MTTAVQAYQFTIDNAVKEWLEQKRTRTGSERTRGAYQDTLQEFRRFLQRGDLDLLSNPIDVARVAGLWANSRNPDTSRRPDEDVTPSTYNQRLAILSSFYTFLRDVYKLDIPNPIESVKKRPVQAYAAAQPLEPETVIAGLESIDRRDPEGLRDYAMLAVGLFTGRRANEITGLRWQDVKIIGRRGHQQITLTFTHCKGAKIMRDKLDIETSAVLLDYLHTQYGKDLTRLSGDTPLWVSYSRQNAGRAISAKTLSNICLTYLGTSQVHALRHTFAVGMMRSGAPITELGGRLGHTDIKITSIYAKEILKEDNPYGERLTERFGIKRRYVN